MPANSRISVAAIPVIALVAFLSPPHGNTGIASFDWQGRRQALQQIQAAQQVPTKLAGLAADLISAASAASALPGVVDWQTWCDPTAMQNCACINGDSFVCNVAPGNAPTGNHSARDPNFIDGLPVSHNLTHWALFKKAWRLLDFHAPPVVKLTLQETIHINPRIRSQFNQIPGALPAQWDNEAITAKARWAVFDIHLDCMVLPIWPGVTNPPSDPVDFATWPQKVAVVRHLTGSPRTCNGWQNLQEVSLSQFYFRPAIFKSQMVLDPTPKQQQAQAINADAVLVGMHMASNEVANWLWTTMWWSPGTSGTRGIGNPWSNYVVEADISMASPPSNSHPNLSAAPIFNPYIEAGLACNNCGVNTDCISCHSQASFDHGPMDQVLGFNSPQHPLRFVWSAPDFVVKPE